MKPGVPLPGEENQKNDDGNRDSEQPQKNGHWISFRWYSPRPRNETLPVPCSVPQLTPFDGREASGESAEQQRGGHPEGELRRTAAGAISCSLGLGDHVVHALFRIGLAHAGPGRYQAREIGPVGGGERAVLAAGGGPQPRCFPAYRTVVGASRACPARGRGRVRA